MQTLNTSLSKFISLEKESVKKFKEPVFSNHPSYEAIKDKEHLFYLFKYLYENPQYLKKESKFVPFSCFDQWEKNYFKPYNEKVYKALFGKDLSEIVTMCITLSPEDFRKEAKRLYKGESLN